MYEEYLAVMRLLVHLEGEQPVYFPDDVTPEQLQELAERKSELMAWFEYNCEHSDGREVVYADFPKRYTFCKDY